MMWEQNLNTFKFYWLKLQTDCILIWNNFHTYTHQRTERTMTTAHNHSIRINKWFQINHKTGAQIMHCLLENKSIFICDNDLYVSYTVTLKDNNTSAAYVESNL